MSQPLSNVGTSAPAKSLWFGSAGKVAGAEGTGATFGQTLVSMLAGEAGSQEGQLTAQLAILAGLTDTSNGLAAEGENESLNALLENLLEQLESLDDALAENPELLAMLQGWLQNAHLYLQNVQQADGSDGAPSDSGIPALAEHAETVRFAVQDTLVQLVAASGSKPSANAELNSLQAKALLESLQTLLSSAGITGEHKSPSGKYASTLADLKGILKENSSVHPDRTGTAADKNVAEAPKVQVVSQAETASVKASASTVLLAGEDTASTAVETSDGEHPFQSGNVVTAGQLALRDAAAAPLKAPAPPVPVEKFGEEMSRFLVSKLEIIQAGGVSEAKISLFPEHLGQVDVKITMQNGQMIAQFMTEHAFAKESLESQMAQLRSALQSQGLQVNKLEVTQNTPLSSHMYQDGRQPGSGTGQQQNGKRREVVSEEELLGIHDLNEEWNEWISSVRETEGTLGSSFVARA
ncbi:MULTISPECIES: flagellar hook-length control protein FliK [Paenibacillus]|uniref:flagellar hook-length control protein FliK n=1 Tax=Paenibacillus TaxID=44249 RepID=UPI002FE1CDA3